MQARRDWRQELPEDGEAERQQPGVGRTPSPCSGRSRRMPQTGGPRGPMRRSAVEERGGPRQTPQGVSGIIGRRVGRRIKRRQGGPRAASPTLSLLAPEVVPAQIAPTRPAVCWRGRTRAKGVRRRASRGSGAC